MCMISVIVAYTEVENFSKLKSNLINRIGVPHELIGYENAEGSKGLCELYNRGSSEASYEILCYLHEDIDIKTVGWGNLVLDLFKDKSLGLLGIAGTNYKPIFPSGWGHPGLGDKNLHYVNILQRFKKTGEVRHLYSNPTAQPLAEVACVDGVWFCTRKSIVKKLSFDEGLLKGFHGYDLDFSLSVGQQYKVKVPMEVLMEHFSEGCFEKEWAVDMIKVHQKWASKLPINIIGLSDREIISVETRVFKGFFGLVKTNRLPAMQIFKILLLSQASRSVRMKISLKVVLQMVVQIMKSIRFSLLAF